LTAPPRVASSGAAAGHSVATSKAAADAAAAGALRAKAFYAEAHPVGAGAMPIVPLIAQEDIVFTQSLKAAAEQDAVRAATAAAHDSSSQWKRDQWLNTLTEEERKVVRVQLAERAHHDADMPPGERSLIADEECHLGLAYEGGNGIGADAIKAAEWFSKAAKAGHALAAHHLSVCYAQGRGVERDAAHAERWRAEAEKAGYKGALLAAAGGRPHGKPPGNKWAIPTVSRGTNQ